MIIANGNRKFSSTKQMHCSVCLPIHPMRPSRARHSIVMNMAPKNMSVIHSTRSKIASKLQLMILGQTKELNVRGSNQIILGNEKQENHTGECTPSQ